MTQKQALAVYIAAAEKMAKMLDAQISPDSLGTMFQSVMEPEKRRELGAHYTSEENVLKVIDELFLNDLRVAFERAKTTSQALAAFHAKIARLRILDPACGCGDFLIVTYRELRKLERDILRTQLERYRRSVEPKVNVSQFYGIEIEAFSCEVARLGMWLVEHLMNREIAEFLGMSDTDWPLKDSAHIHHGNALQIDWESLITIDNDDENLNVGFDYIIGNPPFHGARMMSKSQKADMKTVFGDLKNIGNLDYVTAWYWKAAEQFALYPTRVGFLSTNSIAQGQQPAILWPSMIEKYNVAIDFAYQTFKWHNKAKNKAAVHCVIIGFSARQHAIKKAGKKRAKNAQKHLYDGQNQCKKVAHINAYLKAAPDVFIHDRARPLCDVPMMYVGNQPIDNGNYLFTEAEKDAFLAVEPEAEKYFYPWQGGKEMMNNYHRYCLWLGDSSPDELQRLPQCLKRIEAVRQFRLKSRRKSTQKLAQTPTRFEVENRPQTTYIAIPELNAQSRRYIPVVFRPPRTLASNLVRIIPGASHYHWSILSSLVHAAWARAVAGRFGAGLRYSKGVVYNNFPWPAPTAKDQAKLSALARSILAARAAYPEATLAELYDPATMPAPLLAAHQNCDCAVLQCYGLPADSDEEAIVTELMRRYHHLVAKDKVR